MESSGIDVVLKATHIGSLFGLTITNSLLMTWLVMVVLVVFAFLLRRKLALIPGKLQAGVENDNWSLWLYADNLTDERGQLGKSSIDPAPYAFGYVNETTYNLIRPRTIGVRLGVNF